MKSKMVEFVRIATPYMLDNKGNLLECRTMHPYIMSSFESEEEALKKLLKERFESLLWFHENGNKDIKNYIMVKAHDFNRGMSQNGFFGRVK